jgi:hypothetical protein
VATSTSLAKLVGTISDDSQMVATKMKNVPATMAVVRRVRSFVAEV